MQFEPAQYSIVQQVQLWPDHAVSEWRAGSYDARLQDKHVRCEMNEKCCFSGRISTWADLIKKGYKGAVLSPRISWCMHLHICIVQVQGVPVPWSYYMQATMRMEWLSSLALLHVQYDKAVDLDNVVNIFSKLYPHRLACAGNVTIYITQYKADINSQRVHFIGWKNPLIQILGMTMLT